MLATLRKAFYRLILWQNYRIVNAVPAPEIAAFKSTVCMRERFNAYITCYTLKAGWKQKKGPTARNHVSPGSAPIERIDYGEYVTEYAAS